MAFSVSVSFEPPEHPPSMVINTAKASNLFMLFGLLCWDYAFLF